MTCATSLARVVPAVRDNYVAVVHSKVAFFNRSYFARLSSTWHYIDYPGIKILRKWRYNREDDELRIAVAYTYKTLFFRTKTVTRYVKEEDFIVFTDVVLREIYSE